MNAAQSLSLMRFNTEGLSCLFGDSTIGFQSIRTFGRLHPPPPIPPTPAGWSGISQISITTTLHERRRARVNGNVSEALWSRSLADHFTKCFLGRAPVCVCVCRDRWEKLQLHGLGRVNALESGGMYWFYGAKTEADCCYGPRSPPQELTGFQSAPDEVGKKRSPGFQCCWERRTTGSVRVVVRH